MWTAPEGDLHPKGNPHYLLDPVRAKIVAQNIAAGLARNFPQHQPALEKNLKAYLAELDTWIGRWDKMAAPLRGVKYRRVPSGVGLSCRSLWHEADRQRRNKARH